MPHAYQLAVAHLDIRVVILVVLFLLPVVMLHMIIGGLISDNSNLLHKHAQCEE